MSSNSCNELSAKDTHILDRSETESAENLEKKVCFICGNHTAQIIDIYEPRCGPNMIDVISEKFQMRPLSDDRYLCYNCNNWLINWYTMQKRQHDDSSHEDTQQTTSSTMSAAIATHASQTAAKTSDNLAGNDLVVISDDEDDENVDVNNVIQSLRSRLKKYLYYPNKLKNGDEYQAHPHFEPEAAIDGLTADAQVICCNCERCGRSIRKHINRRKKRIMCRNCRFSMRRHTKYTERLEITAPHHLARRQKTQISSRTDNQTETSPNRIHIFEKLQQLGTSIYYEHECNAKHLEQQHRMTSTPHEIDTHRKPTNAWKRRATDESNEIVMTFNTVVTEVFPIEQLYNQFDRQDDQLASNKLNVAGTLNIQEILRNVPKSLSITIA